ncbi:MAG: vitamin K epoxide reductase family protein [Candidatus Paceibacterota bacterium]
MKNVIKADIVFYFILLIVGVGGFLSAITWPETEGFYVFICLSALSGLGVAGYIYYKKSSNSHLICPSGSDCDVVIGSKYSKFLKVPLEYWGISYYVSIIVSYGLFLMIPELRSGILMPLIIILTSAALLFSLYLIFVQGFILRNWCIWCLLSAMMSISIFIAALVSIESILPSLVTIEPVLILMKDLGFIFGIGGATAAVFIFMKFLEDYNLDHKEVDTLKSFYESIWLGLALVFISKYSLYIIHAQTLSSSSLFHAEMIGLFVVLIAGVVFKIILSPFLVVLPFKKEKEGDKKSISLESVQRTTILTGAIALASWYFSFFTNYIPEYSISTLMVIYLIFLLSAVILAIILNNSINKKGVNF